MNKLIKQQFKNINLNAKDFFSQKQLNLLIYGVNPKILLGFKGKHKKLWTNTFNTLLPKNTLGFNTENDYLKDNNIDKNNVIENSILYSLPDIESEDVKNLGIYFSIFSEISKIKTLTIDNKLIPVYIEIINILEYIKSIQMIISKYPKYNGNYHGTKHRSSSYKELLNSQLNMLDNRLNGLFFPIENEDERKKVEIQVKFINLALKDEYKNLPEWFNFASIYLGFDNTFLKMTNNEKQAFIQLTTFFNGIRTSKEELLNSVMIYTRLQSKIKNDDELNHNEVSKSIINILRFFFNKEIIEVQKKKNKKTIVYKSKHIKKDYCIKTYLYELPIYTYSNKNTNDALSEFIQISLDSITGINNISEKNKETSHIQTIKDLIKFRNEFNFTKEEFKAFIFFSKKYFN